MSEQSTAPETNDAPTELDLLKARAEQLGIPYKANIGLAALKKKVNAKMTGEDEDEEDDDEDEVAAKAPRPVKKSKEQIEQELRDSLQKEKLRLIRVRISNLNPSKNDLSGEIITVANRYIGTVRKFIPYQDQSENGYHLEQVLVDDLRRRKFQQVLTKKVKGQLIPITRLVPEFQIVEMPRMTKAELDRLADRQSAASRLEGNDD